jgi:hypothetical protein
MANPTVRSGGNYGDVNVGESGKGDSRFKSGRHEMKVPSSGGAAKAGSMGSIPSKTTFPTKKV